MKKVDLKKRVLREYEKFPSKWRDKPWFLALSGGEDSTVLAHVLLALRPKIPPLHFLHVNYHLRPPHCDREERHLTRWARQEEVPLWIHSADPKGKPASLQDWARRERYQFFQRLMAEQAPLGGVLLTAHHQGDQVETILSRCLTGASWKGLAGMSPWEERKTYVLFRPLLEVPKAALSAYATSHELRFFLDSSNRKPTYLRNRIRLQLMPWLQKENPQIESRILAWGQAAGEVARILQNQSKRWLKRQGAGPGSRNLPVAPLLKAGPALRSQILAEWLQGHWGHLRNLGRHLSAVEGALGRLPAGQTLLGPGKTLLKISNTTIEIKKKK